MVNIGNFDINNQCPQVYIYIFSVLTTIILLAKHGKTEEVIFSVIYGLTTVVWMMGVNYCDWTFQWLTWFMAVVYLTIAITNIILFIDEKNLVDVENAYNTI